MLKSMPATLFTIVVLASFSGGIALSSLIQWPNPHPIKPYADSLEFLPKKTRLHGTITSVDPATKTINFQVVSPYALGEVLPLRVTFDDQTDVELLEDRQKNESTATYLALHGVTTLIQVEMQHDPGVLYADYISESRRKQQ